MNIEGPRNFTGAFSIWTGVLHIYVQLSGAKINASPLGKLYHRKKIMDVRRFEILLLIKWMSYLHTKA